MVDTRPLSSIHVLGAGPTGSLAALLLSQQHQRVVLHDPQDHVALLSRSRAYAITHSCRRLLLHVGLWPQLADALIPFNSLDLRDQATQQRVVFDLNDLAQANRDFKAIGWILDHRPLMTVLLERLRSHSTVELHLGTPAPPADANSLIVAADGPNSSIRNSWGIGRWQINYRQGCLSAKVRLRGLPAQQAFELFRPEGPLAILPLGGNNVQVVWSAPLHQCRQRSELSTGVFLDQLAAVLPAGLEPDQVLDQPRAFPQQWMLARRLSSGRGVLLGEAGHRCHPVGGQGLNLCWRDVETLQHAVHAGGTPAAIAKRYGRRRWLDVLLVGVSTDALVRLFSNRTVVLLPLRTAILQLLLLSSALRKLSLKAMSDGPMQLFRRLSE